MHIKTRNVNTAFRHLVNGIFTGEIPTWDCASRYGTVAMVEEPVIVTYQKPRERVLFNPVRDCNPFFHLYEAIWMLAGRSDVAPLVYYNKRMQEFSDDGKWFNSAYGHRWRGHFGIDKNHPNKGRTDQLKTIINHLQKHPESRRAVLQIWDVANDLGNLESSKDIACNTCVYFLIEQGVCKSCKGSGVEPSAPNWAADEPCLACKGKGQEVPQYLNMTVCNRSNDMIWGMLGANAAHFSFLQEYIATALNLEVGVYNQITNNLHVYTKNWKPEEWLDDQTPDNYPTYFPKFFYDRGTFDIECRILVDRHSKDAFAENYTEPFLACTVQPACIAFHYHKRRQYESALEVAKTIQAPDWQRACIEWLERRKYAYSKRETSGGTSLQETNNPTLGSSAG